MSRLHRSVARTFSGEWWIPTASDKKVPGELLFGGRFPRLRLERSLSEENISIIHGNAGGHSVTLQQCHVLGSGTAAANAIVECAYLGGHFLSEEDFKFREIQIELVNFDDWVRWSNWRRPGLSRDNWDPNKFRIEYSRAPDLIADTEIGRFAVAVFPEQRGDFFTELAVKEHLYVSVRTEEPKTFQTLSSRVVRPLVNLVSLATTNIVPIRAVYVMAPRKVFVGAEPQMIEMRTEVLGPIGPRRANHPRSRIPQSMLFTLADVEDRLSDTLNRWFRFYDDFRIPLDIFFTVRNSKGGYFEHRFLSLAQVAESYHRFRIRRVDFSGSELNRRISRIESTFPDYAGWLRARLAGGNEVVFSDRLVELIDKSRSLVGPIISDVGELVAAIVKTRNKFVHASPDFSPTPEGQYGLFRLTAVLSLLMEEYLLRELGFDEADAAQRVGRTVEYAYARSLRAQHEF